MTFRCFLLAALTGIDDLLSLHGEPLSVLDLVLYIGDRFVFARFDVEDLVLNGLDGEFDHDCVAIMCFRMCDIQVGEVFWDLERSLTVGMKVI